jgi:hypothetical protein
VQQNRSATHSAPHERDRFGLLATESSHSNYFFHRGNGKYRQLTQDPLKRLPIALHLWVAVRQSSARGLCLAAWVNGQWTATGMVVFGILRPHGRDPEVLARGICASTCLRSGFLKELPNNEPLPYS